MHGEARNLGHVGGDADVDRGQVERDVGTAGDFQGPSVRVKRFHPAEDQTGIGEARQFDQIDLESVAGIVSGDEARQHACIGRRGGGVDQRQSRARHRRHAPTAQEQSMGVSAADKDDVPGVGKRHRHHVRSLAVARWLGERVRARSSAL